MQLTSLELQRDLGLSAEGKAQSQPDLITTRAM